MKKINWRIILTIVFVIVATWLGCVWMEDAWCEEQTGRLWQNMIEIVTVLMILPEIKKWFVH